MNTRVVGMRCFAEQTAGGNWEAHCVDLGLKAEGDSLQKVKSKLDRLIHQHIDEDAEVISTPAPAEASPGRLMQLRLRYWGLYLAGRLGLRDDALRTAAMPRSSQPRYSHRMATGLCASRPAGSRSPMQRVADR